MTDARTYLDEKGRETVAAWIASGFASKHATRPNPEKERARAAAVLAQLVTTYGDRFVARQIGDYAAWCASHPTRVANRVRHDDALRRWTKIEAEKFAAQQPGARPKPPSQQPARDLARYTCPKCQRSGKAEYLRFAKHVDACQAVTPHHV